MEALSEVYIERLRSQGTSAVSIAVAEVIARSCDKSGFARGVLAAVEQLTPYVVNEPGGTEKLVELVESVRLLGDEIVADAELRGGV
jgi:hypothetical protein